MWVMGRVYRVVGNVEDEFMVYRDAGVVGSVGVGRIHRD